MKKNVVTVLLLALIMAISCKEEDKEVSIVGVWKVEKAEPFVNTSVDSVTDKIYNYIQSDNQFMLDAKLTFNASGSCVISYKDSLTAKSYAYSYAGRIVSIYSTPQITLSTTISKDSLLLMKYYINSIDSTFLRDKLNVIDPKNTINLTNLACIYRCSRQ